MAGTLWHEPGDPLPCHGERYQPREGDLVFFSSVNPAFVLAYSLAGSFHPWHVGMIVRHSSGELVVMESGGIKNHCVVLRPIYHRLSRYLGYLPRARIWVRRIKHPLTPEQSRCLTAFAERQCGKRFCPLLRLGQMVLPGRPLDPSHPDQDRWFCAELVTESLRTCGLVPWAQLYPEATTPRDLFIDECPNLSCGWERPRTWSPNCCPPPPGPLCGPR